MNEYDDSPTNVQNTPPPGRPLNQDQKSAIAAALGGTAALGGAAWGMSRYYLEDDTTAQVNTNLDESDQPTSDSDQSHAQVSDTTLSPPVELPQLTDQQSANGTLVSTLDRDSMTFEDAFREARNEMGPGNYFEWHGQLYNTFYKDEWEHMSPGAQQEFLASVYGDDMPQDNSGGMLAGGEIPSNSHPSVPAAITPIPVDNPDIIVEDEPVHSVADVTVEEPTGDPLHNQNVDIAIVDLIGHEVAVFDTDNDDRPDAMMFTESNIVLLDTDHDHLLDTQATYDTDSHKLVGLQSLNDKIKLDGSMDILHKSENQVDPMLADKNDFDEDLGIDFDSDTDISDYV